MSTTAHTDRLTHYLDLITQPYSQAVATLQAKYGNVTANYFQEPSYQRFLAGEIKTIAKGDFSRTNDGLLTHHVAEDHYENLSNPLFINVQRPPYAVQEADQLVYCDEFEHLILHALIMAATHGNLGTQGYQKFLLPTITNWYLKDETPTTDWEQRVKDQATLTAEETQQVLDALDNGPLLPIHHAKERLLRFKEIFETEYTDRWHVNGTNPYLGVQRDRTFVQLRVQLGSELEEQLFDDYQGATDDWCRRQIEIKFKDYLYSPEEAAAKAKKP